VCSSNCLTLSIENGERGHGAGFRFQRLAISLLFGLASSTLPFLPVIPAIYIVLGDDGCPLSEEETA